MNFDSRKKSDLLNSNFNLAGGPLTVTELRLTALMNIFPELGTSSRECIVSSSFWVASESTL